MYCWVGTHELTRDMLVQHEWNVLAVVEVVQHVYSLPYASHTRRRNIFGLLYTQYI